VRRAAFNLGEVTKPKHSLNTEKNLARIDWFGAFLESILTSAFESLSLFYVPELKVFVMRKWLTISIT
jgi:hypothetical protein